MFFSTARNSPISSSSHPFQVSRFVASMRSSWVWNNWNMLKPHAGIPVPRLKNADAWGTLQFCSFGKTNSQKNTKSLRYSVCVCELLCFFEDPGSCTLSYFAHTQPVFPTSTVFDHALGPSWRKQD